MSAIIAVCIFGNVVVMTFTASRVKQEIAKEGVLPFSLFFATGHTTPDAWLRKKFSRKQRSEQDSEVFPEQSPMAALLLHWSLSVLLIGATASLTAATAYFALVFLYSYVLLAMIGVCVSSGLLYLYFNPSIPWHEPGSHGFRPWGGPTAAIIYGAVSLFVIVTAFLKPADGSPFATSTTHIQWYILPAIGLSSVFWGVIWWIGLHIVMRSKRLELVVTRVPHIEFDAEEGSGEDGSEGGEWVQRSEVIVRAWMSRAYVRAVGKGSEGSEMEDMFTVRENRAEMREH